MRKFRATCVILAASLELLACGSSRKPIVVGSKNGTEQTLLGEIVAQHLERKLGAPVERRLAFGGTAILYQALTSGQVSIYPEYTGTIESEILKEQPSQDPATVLVRSRAEMLRTAQSELLDPLGFESPPAVVVRAADAPRITTLSQAGAGATQWKLGVTFDFLQRSDGLPALNTYRLPMGAAVRSVDMNDLFPLLEKGELNMIVVDATDGHLISPNWKALEDDRRVFSPQQACLLVRQESLSAEPRLRPALVELSGKITAETMRRLNARVELEKRPVAQVAAEFLASLGLR
jgi:osmoprotectant transport system substrate-binding protein